MWIMGVLLCWLCVYRCWCRCGLDWFNCSWCLWYCVVCFVSVWCCCIVWRCGLWCVVCWWCFCFWIGCWWCVVDCGWYCIWCWLGYWCVSWWGWYCSVWYIGELGWKVWSGLGVVICCCLYVGCVCGVCYSWCGLWCGCDNVWLD